MRGIEHGQRVRIVRRRFYAPGDVVVVRRKDHWNIHRFLGYAWGSNGLVALTQADDATWHDPPAPVQRMLGRVERRVPVVDRIASARSFVVACVRQIRR